MMQDEVVAEALARIEADYPLVREDGFYRKKIIEILDSEKTAAFFSVSDGEVWCEKEIVDSSGDTKRLDRLIVKDKEVWVIDYKSSREGEEKQRAQVREYLRLVSALYPGRAIKGFILYMDELSVEQI